MTDFDFRALCAELIAGLDGDCCPETQGNYYSSEAMNAITRARAALDEPEGKKPTEEQLDIVVIAIQSLTPHSLNTDSRNLEAVDRGRRILQRAITRWGRPAAPTPKPIPLSERLPGDADCLVITAYNGTSSFDEHYCYLAKEFKHCGQVLLIWELKPTSALRLNLPFTYWLPASTRFLPTTVDPAQLT